MIKETNKIICNVRMKIKGDKWNEIEKETFSKVETLSIQHIMSSWKAFKISLKMIMLNISSGCVNTLLISFQNHQNQLDIFDGNVAHISTWLYQAEALLDEIEKKPASKQEEIVKVAKEEQSYSWGWKVWL